MGKTKNKSLETTAFPAIPLVPFPEKYSADNHTRTNEYLENIYAMGFENEDEYKRHIEGLEEYDPNNEFGWNEEQWYAYLMANKMPTYIGGTQEQARIAYFNQHPELINDIKNIAAVYNINPKYLAQRLAQEGFIDESIRDNNDIYNNLNKPIPELTGNRYLRDIRNLSDYNVKVPKLQVSGFNDFGLDTVGGMINTGEVTLKNNERWTPVYLTNEKEDVVTADGVDSRTNISLMGATLSAFKEQAKKDFPGISEEDANKYATIYYNRGKAIGKKYIKNNSQNLGYNVYPGIAKLFERHGGKISLERPIANIGIEEQTQEPTYWGGLMNEVVVRPDQEPIVISPKVSRAYAQEDAAREAAMKQAGDITRNIHSATNKAAPILGNVLLGAQTAPLTIGLEAINQANPTAGAIAGLLSLTPTAVRGIASAGKFGLSAAKYLYRKLDPVYDFYKTTQETPIIENLLNNFNSNYINSNLGNNSRFRKGDLFIDWHKAPIYPITAEEKLGIPKGERNNVFSIKPDNIYGNIRFIRNIEDLPTVDKNGLVHLGKDSENLLANFTTDLPFRLHSWYPNIPGSTYMVVSPRAFKGKRFLSIEPSDSFLFSDDAIVSPNQVRIISGNSKVLDDAAKKGMRTISSDKLKQLYEQGKAITSKEYELGLNGAERPFQNSDNAADNLRWNNVNMSYPKEGIVTPYRQEVDRIITENIGRPTLRDYKNLEDITGLKANYVSQYSDDLIKDANDPLASESMFEHVFYPVTSPVESNLMESVGLYGHPQTSFFNWLTLNSWLNKGNIKPLKKFGGRISLETNKFAGGGEMDEEDSAY